MVARIFEDFEINSPSSNDVKNKIIILYHLTFHNDLSSTGFSNDFINNCKFQEISQSEINHD